MVKRYIVVLAILCGVIVAGISLDPKPVSAATIASECDKSGNFLSVPTWYKYLDVEYTEAGCKVKLPQADGRTDVRLAISRILLAVFEILLRLGTYLAIGIVMYGGIQYVISQGEPERTKNARTTILNAIIGLVITISSTAIVNLIARNIIG
jgi:hypothetical protein